MCYIVYMFLRLIKQKIWLVFFCIVFFAMCHSVYAQNIVNQTGLALALKPEFPEPHEMVEVTFSDYGTQVSDYTIMWYIDGVEQKNFKNLRSITIDAGSLGNTKQVRASLVKANAPTLHTSLAITPIYIDIILESDTYVPRFYKGRSLPSNDANMRATAVVHTGAYIPAYPLSYTWSMGETIFGGGGIKNASALTFTLPFFQNGPLQLDIFDSRGIHLGKKYVFIAEQKPTLLFYEFSPLKGLSHRALDTTTHHTEQETTIYGEPYFFKNPNLHTSNTKTEWKIGSTIVQNTSTPKNAITLHQSEGARDAHVELALTTLNVRVPQTVRESFTVIFK